MQLHQPRRDRAIDPGTPHPASPSGRVCAEGGCDTILSIYNPKSVCWIHRRFEEGLYRLRTPGRKKKVAA